MDDRPFHPPAVPCNPPVTTVTIAATDAIRRDLEALVLERDRGILFGPQVMTLHQWMHRLAETDAPIAHVGIRRLAVAKALATVPLRYFGAVRYHPGTIGLLEQTIRTLKSGGLAAGTLRELFATRGGAAEFDLLHTYETYNELLATWGFVDQGDLLELGCQRLLVECPTSVQFVGFEPNDPIFRRLSDIIAKGAPMKQSSDQHTCRDDTTVTAPGIDVDVIAAPTPMQEYRWVAQYCANEISTQGIAARAIALVVPIHPEGQRLLMQELIHVGVLPVSTMAHMTAHELTHIDPRRWQQSIAYQPVEHWLRAWHGMLADAESPARLADDFRRHHGDAPIGGVLQYLGRLATMTRQLEALCECAPDHDMTAMEFRTIVAQLLQQEPLPRDDGGIRLCDFDAVPLQLFAQVITTDCLEGHRPTAPTPLPFCMSPDFRDEACAALRTLLPLPEALLAAAERQWQQWWAHARNVAIATYPRTGIDGRETIASLLLPPMATPLTVDFLPSTSGSDRPTDPPGRLTHDITLTDPAVRAHIGARFRSHCFSVSQLERYATSPFVFYCERVLGLRPDETATPEVKPKDRGTVIHAILERFCRDQIALFQSAITQPIPIDTIAAHVSTLANAVMTEYRQLFVGTHPALIERLRASAQHLCTQLLSNELSMLREVPAPLTPLVTEWAFGEGEVPPLRIDLPDDTPIYLRGRVDRIDADPTARHFAIFDYKTGSPKSPKAEIVKGVHLQLPIYLLAVEQLLLPHAEAIAGLSIATQRQAKRMGIAKHEHNNHHYQFRPRDGSLCSTEEWTTLRATAEQHLRALVAAIRRAEFPADRHDCTTWCEWRDVCGLH